MTKASDNEFPSVLFIETVAPADPAAGDQRLFIDPVDHLLKLIDSSGTITPVGSGSGGAFMGCSAKNTTTQSVSNATETPLTFDAEDYDTDAIHAGGSPTRFTVPTGGAGKWMAVGYTSWDTNTSGQIRYLWWLLNGTRIPSSIVSNPPAAGGLDQRNTLGPVILADGDYIEAAVYQDSGGSRTVSVGADQRAGVVFWRVA